MLLARFLSAKTTAALALGAGALVAGGTAQARDVSWSVGVHAAPGVTIGVGNSRPVVQYAQPVYVQPTPVYVQPAPVYVHPAPVPQTIYTVPQVIYTQPQVVYPAGALGYYQRPGVIVHQGYPVHRSAWSDGHRGHGHGHGHWRGHDDGHRGKHGRHHRD